MNYENDTRFIHDGMNKCQRCCKRLFDIVVSLLCMVLFSPLILLFCIAIKVEDGGYVFFSQERVGLHGKSFNILKFRSLKQGHEEDKPQLIAEGCLENLTKVGKFMRDHHLDELPQLWNVFVGDMTFVGPRPERRYFIDRIMEKDIRYRYLYQIRPGVTSYATLYNGYTDNIEKMLKRLEYDLYYLEHRSLHYDLKILWLTFYYIAIGKKF